MANLMSTQRHYDDAIVEAKQAAGDYAVQIVRLEIEGVVYDYIVDGHHSLRAAIEDGAEPEIEDVTDRYAAEIAHLGPDQWLVAHHLGDDPYNPITGADIF